MFDIAARLGIRQAEIDGLKRKIQQLKTELYLERSTGGIPVEDFRAAKRYLFSKICPACGLPKQMLNPLCNGCFHLLKEQTPRVWQKLYQVFRRPFVREYMKLIRSIKETKQFESLQSQPQEERSHV